MVHAIKSR
jgi:hypothetical protein